jgi:putative inorganic carbon (hco3(-)) transporter
VLTLAVLNGPWPRLGVVAAALLAAGAIVARSDVRRAWAMLGALVLAPVLLLDDVWRSSQLHFIHRHPAEGIVGAVVVLAALAAASVVINRIPWLVAPLTALTLPFRIPISTGIGAAATTNNLLVPLYFVIAASALAWLVPVLWATRADAPPRPPREPRPGPLLFEKLLGAFIVLYALEALYSTDFVNALQNEIFFYVPFAVLLTRLRDLDWSRELLIRCLLVTVALAVVLALIGFGEELTQTLWLNSNLLASNELHAYFQVNSVFYDPDIFGRYLALVMILLMTVVLYDRRARVQFASLVTIAILWGCLLFTLSRSSLVSLALGLAVLAAFRWRTRPVIYLGVAVVIAGAIVIAVKPGSFGLNQGANGATSGRANLITGGARLLGERPLYGWGSGSFSVEYRRHNKLPVGAVSQSHNIPVTVAAEQGIIGELVYLALVIAAVIALFRGARGDPFRVGIAAAFLALMLHTTLYADFLEDPVTWTLLAVGGSLAVAARSAAANEPRERRLSTVA